MVKKIVAIFGRADIKENEEMFFECYKCAKILASNGFSIVTGGYGGIMEAASKGAYDSFGEAIGVICSSFAERKPNKYLTKVIVAKDLFERQRNIIELANFFIAFEPKAGTLSEVSLLLALRKSGIKGDSPLCLIGRKWLDLFDFFKRERIVDENLLKYIFFFGDANSCSDFVLNFNIIEGVSSG